MFSEIIRVPKERLSALRGENGTIKKELEDTLDIALDIREDGEVFIEGESINLLTAKAVVRAIARGFDARTALLLTQHDTYVFDMLDITEFSGKSKNSMMRLKGRVIGREGKSKRKIERQTGTNIEVYGKTIGIIGQAEQVAIARKAVTMLLEGAMHSTVSRFLERAQNELQTGFVRGFEM
ncbi:RNA-processing protein [archaeon CG10_big_fil_rev_8_21_14_0_10_43_11]|nr:MAG: RNA-processing protein [archaeon CG10_big_fil_rev_8_21_14_0_10_43_11]